MSKWILAINPGSTSTKLGVFENDTLHASTTLRHHPQQLALIIAQQLERRTEWVLQWLDSVGIDNFDAVVGRGGMLKPIPGGTYAVNATMRDDLRQGVQGEHASNLGGLIAHALAQPRDIPAYIVDPVSVDELSPVARISGLPDTPRRSLSHALNIKAVARRVACDLGRQLRHTKLIMVHLGGGISVASLQGGYIVDVNNANEMGPFSPERSGGLPVGNLLDMAFSGQYSQQQLLSKIRHHGGLLAYLGTNDGQEVHDRINAGDSKAELIAKAMAYQVSKEIGSMATVQAGDVDAIVLTGGLAHFSRLTDWIKESVDFIAPVLIYAGEDELLAMAQGCLRVLRGQEQAREYY